MKRGKEYELLVEQIYKELQDDAVIVQDDHLPAYNSGGKRQIDLTIRYTVANVSILIIVQVKDFKIKANIGYVDEFVGVMKDVRADKGIMICSKGFSQKAINSAKTHNIQLYSAHAAQHAKWHKEIGIPAFKIHHKFEYTLQFTLSEGRLSLSKGDRIKKLRFRMGENILSDGYLIGLITRNNILLKDKRDHNITFDSEHIEASWGAGTWVKLKSITLIYRFIKTETFSNDITPKDYRYLKDCANEMVEFSFFELDLIPLVVNSSDWRRTDYDITKQSSNQHLIVTVNQMGTVLNYSLDFFKPKRF